MHELINEWGVFAVLGFGLLLGFRHAFDPDHVVAVSTIVGEYRNPFRSFWIGISWGLGHTTTLFLIGIVIIGLRLTIPEGLAQILEGFVALMLIGLGVQVLYTLRKKKAYQHIHGHEEDDHSQFHSHSAGYAIDSTGHHEKDVWTTAITKGIGRPFFRTKSFLIGTVHGLAGSAALTLLILASIESALVGLGYILVFGLGSVLSMGIVTMFISVPFVLAANRSTNLNGYIQLITGVVSILFGGFLIVESFAEQLIQGVF